MALAVSLTAGCDRNESAGTPLPTRSGSRLASVGSSRPSADAPSGCTSGAAFTDRATAPFLPPVAGGFCLDPGSPERAIGDDTPRDIDQLCALIDGECEIYKRFQVRRVVEARYGASAGSASTIDVFVSRYASSEMAYGMFTYRVVGDGDPFRSDAPTPLEVSGQATLGHGNAYLWHGSFLVELTLNDDQASASQIEARASELLPALAREIGKRLPGESPLPVAASALPAENRAATGIRFFPNDVLGISDAGAGAVGYYQQSEQRWRLVSGVELDVDRAKDAMRAIGKIPGAAEHKPLGDDALRLVLTGAPGAPTAEWLFIRKGGRVLGIGDESTVLVDSMSAASRRTRTLSTEEKRSRLRAWLGQ